jgi:tetrahydromethanopterin S-methyltransferase subunit B
MSSSGKGILTDLATEIKARTEAEIERDEIKLSNDKLKNKVQNLKTLLESFRNNWDCDTGANGSHPSYCRVCCASKMLNEDV